MGFGIVRKILLTAHLDTSLLILVPPSDEPSPGFVIHFFCSTAKGIAQHSHAVIVHCCPFEDCEAGTVVNNLASSRPPTRGVGKKMM